MCGSSSGEETLSMAAMSESTGPTLDDTSCVRAPVPSKKPGMVGVIYSAASTRPSVRAPVIHSAASTRPPIGAATLPGTSTPIMLSPTATHRLKRDCQIGGSFFLFLIEPGKRVYT
jgi:hypothetical protein